jgi:DNA-binding transcriptional LysR family regulator
MLNLHQLRIFWTASRERRLKSAAELLGLTPSAVTKSIRRFEDEVGVKLVASTGHTFLLTNAGEALASCADQIFRHETMAEKVLERYRSSRDGSLVVHTSETFGAYHLPEVLMDFGFKNPDVRIEANLIHNQQAWQSTLSLQNDCSIVSGEVEHPDLEVLPLLKEPLILIAPQDHPILDHSPIQLWHLHGQEMLVHEQGSFPRRALEEIAEKHGFDYKIRMELSNNEAIKCGVKRGLGLALISPYTVRRELESQEVVRVEIPEIKVFRTYSLVLHRERYRTESLQEFVRHLQSWGKAQSENL